MADRFSTPDFRSDGPYMAVVGVFDGFHTGHQYMMRQLESRSHAVGLKPMVVTFLSHPALTLHPESAALLMDNVTRLETVNALKMKTVALDFPAFRSLTAEQFMRLLSEKGVKALLMGWDTRFGSDMPDSPEYYDAAGAAHGITVSHLDRHGTASSSAIRRAVAEGRIEDASSMLGTPYRVCGRVVKGRQLGRTIGFPTANLEPREPHIQLPPTGVYVTEVSIGADKALGGMRAVTNVGHRPTVEGTDDAPLTIETHIPGLECDLYGQETEVAFLTRLRPERRMPSLEALKEQIHQDLKQALAAPSPWKN